MALVNEHFLKLPENYFFSDLEKRVNLFRVTHPKADIIRLVQAMSSFRCHTLVPKPCGKP